MSLTLAQLADAIDAELRGDGAVEVTGCAGLEDAGPADVSFLANRKYVRLMAETRAAAVIVSPQDAEEHAGRTLLVADDPYYAFREAVVALYGFRGQPEPGVSELAFVDPGAQLGTDCSIQPFVHIAAGAKIGDRCVIHPHCSIGPEAVIGDDCILYPNVVVYDKCVLGDRVILQAGCVIGQDGFGYATHQLPGEETRHHKIPQVGNVVIEDDVELGAGCTIDRATVGATRIGRGTKFSDLIAIGHGCSVGNHNLLVAQVGLAGSVTTGDYVVMGGQVGVVGHVRIGHGAQLAGKTAVINDIPDGQAQYGGLPAQPLNEAKRTVLLTYQLPEMLRQLKQLKRRVEQLEKAVEADAE